MRLWEVWEDAASDAAVDEREDSVLLNAELAEQGDMEAAEMMGDTYFHGRPSIVLHMARHTAASTLCAVVCCVVWQATRLLGWSPTHSLLRSTTTQRLLKEAPLLTQTSA